MVVRPANLRYAVVMARYVPEVKNDRRKKLPSVSDIETIRVALLGIFLIMLTFFVALVASTKPDETRTINLISSLQSTFTNLKDIDQLNTPPSIPAWLDHSAADSEPAPLDEMRRLFPQAFAKDTGNWGAVELRFTPDLFQRFLYTDLALAKRFFAGFSDAQPVTAEGERYMLELTVGTRGRTRSEAQQLLQQIRKDFDEIGVERSRVIAGFEPGTNDIVMRLTPASRYRGAL